MKTVVITGSTRGIGFGMAEAFLARGCVVVVSGRGREGTDRAAAALSARHPADRILGTPCDAGDYRQVKALWDAAAARFGGVDIWVNNAGVSRPQRKVWENPPEDLRTVVETNLLGALNGTKVAMEGMLAQGRGAIYNMEGMGAEGGRVEGLALYGLTKRAIAYLDRALAAEARGTPIIVGAILPGMVATEMLSDQYKDRPEEWGRAKRIFNILADPVDEIAPWAAERMLRNTRSGIVMKRRSSIGLMGRFLLAPFRKRELFPGPPGPGNGAN
jgi:NAD(P)-dependent dehydrogenase (short-subunit alcohol dehydrogenase family)